MTEAIYKRNPWLIEISLAVRYDGAEMPSDTYVIQPIKNYITKTANLYEHYKLVGCEYKINEIEEG